MESLISEKFSCFSLDDRFFGKILSAAPSVYVLLLKVAFSTYEVYTGWFGEVTDRSYKSFEFAMFWTDNASILTDGFGAYSKPSFFSLLC